MNNLVVQANSKYVNLVEEYSQCKTSKEKMSMDLQTKDKEIAELQKAIVHFETEINRLKALQFTNDLISFDPVIDQSDKGQPIASISNRTKEKRQIIEEFDTLLSE